MTQIFLFYEICKEYDKVYQELIDGTIIHVPVVKGSVKRVFPIVI